MPDYVRVETPGFGDGSTWIERPPIGTEWVQVPTPGVGDGSTWVKVPPPSLPTLTQPAIRTSAVSFNPTSETDVSLLGKIGKGLGAIGKAAVQTFVPGGGAIVAGVSALQSATRRAAPPPTVTGAAGLIPTTAMPLTLPGIGGMIGRAGGAVGTAVGVTGLVGGALGLTSGSGCGCNNKNGRDPCTGQKLSSQRAPEATFFGGCCPPGRTLVRRPWARDICAKRRTMNPFNPSALARADRRLTSFAKRSSVMLRDMGFQVSRSRKVSVGKKRKRR